MFDSKSARFNRVYSLGKRVDLFDSPTSDALATELNADHPFRLVENGFADNAVMIQTLMDGYHAWLKLEDIAEQVTVLGSNPHMFTKSIAPSQDDFHQMVGFIEKCAQTENRYRWGGNLGPHYDCSGLVQATYRSLGYLLPRDANQQELWCESVNGAPSMGDLVFFGTESATHVGFMLNDHEYWHSSGAQNGNDGIGLNSLRGDSKVDRHYASLLRGFGRVTKGYGFSFCSS